MRAERHLEYEKMGPKALEAIYLSAHSGGKFSEKTYQNVSGQNGIGGKGVPFCKMVYGTKLSPRRNSNLNSGKKVW